MGIFDSALDVLGLGAPDNAGMSAEERELINIQRDILEEMRSLQGDASDIQRMLQPILLRSMGFDVELDENGKITNITTEGGEPLLRDVLQERLYERALKAVQGDLPSDPALVRELKEREDQLTEQLAKDFGSISAGRTSSPGMERLQDFEQFRFEALDQSRRRDIGQITGLALETEAGRANTLNQLFGVIEAPRRGFNDILASAAGINQQVTQARQFDVAAQSEASGRLAEILGIAAGTGTRYLFEQDDD